MKNAMPYVYMIMGFVAGFVVGAAEREATGFPLLKLGYLLAAIIVVVLYVRFERTSYNRHFSKWESHQRRGRTYFILVHYAAERAIPILLILIVPMSLKTGFAVGSVPVLVLTCVIALVAFGFLGNQEWAKCQAEFSIQSLKDEAERAKQMRSRLPGSGV